LAKVAIRICGQRHWLWRAADQHGIVLNILVRSRRDQLAAEGFLRQSLTELATSRESSSPTS
jgi:putative transposase